MLGILSLSKWSFKYPLDTIAYILKLFSKLSDDVMLMFLECSLDIDNADGWH